MSVRKARLARLEAGLCQQREYMHHTSIVYVPFGLSTREIETYIAVQPCACGQVACPQRMIGAIVLGMLSKVQWNQQVQAYQARTRKGWPDDLSCQIGRLTRLADRLAPREGNHERL
jgi:hypothetical protein